MGRTLGLLLAGVIAGSIPPPVAAQSVTLTQITDTLGAFGNIQPSLDAAGTRIAFRSIARGIVLFDTTTGRFTEIGGSTAIFPSISADGTRIAFSSSGDLTPGHPGNADGNPEIFLFDATTGAVTQITNTTGGFNDSPSIDGTGTRIAFRSNRDLTPGNPGNADGNIEVFLFDTATGRFTQITDTTLGTGAFPVINVAGSRIVFASDRDLTPGHPGNADGNLEIFLFDVATARFTQITATTGRFSDQPSINGAGTRIAFRSTADLTPGSPGNADGNTEIFLFDTTTGRFAQVTDTTGGPFGGLFANVEPSIDAAGRRIAFRSTRDLTPGRPGNADGNDEIFLFDTANGRFIQITSTITGMSQSPSINADGTRIAFSSSGDLTPGRPGNADHNLEIFLASLAEVAEVPTLGPSLQVVLTALLIVGGLYALRRRR